jgi:hypothetical protein
MSNQGTREQGLALAKERWAALHCFDLDEETWQRLYASHHVCDVLQALTETRKLRNRTDAAVVFRHFEQSLTRLTEKRNAFRDIYQHFAAQDYVSR